MQQITQSSNNSNTGNITASTQQGPPNGDFREGKFDGRGGHEGHGGSSSPFLVILNYFGIWVVIIIPTYFLEKRILKNKRKTNHVQLQNSK
jgi:hypothetical protein